MSEKYHYTSLSTCSVKIWAGNTIIAQMCVQNERDSTDASHRKMIRAAERMVELLNAAASVANTGGEPHGR